MVFDAGLTILESVLGVPQVVEGLHCLTTREMGWLDPLVRSRKWVHLNCSMQLFSGLQIHHLYSYRSLFGLPNWASLRPFRIIEYIDNLALHNVQNPKRVYFAASSKGFFQLQCASWMHSSMINKTPRQLVSRPCGATSYVRYDVGRWYSFAS